MEVKKSRDYNYEKWIPIIDFIGLKDQVKRDWLINYLQSLEDNNVANYTPPNNI